MTTAEQLRAAADVLRRRGWIQDRWFGQTGQRCAVSSLSNVTAGGQLIRQAPQFRAALRALVTAIGASVPATFDSDIDETLTYANIVTRWNDAPGQTAENVIDTLELAAICQEQSDPYPETAETLARAKAANLAERAAALALETDPAARERLLEKFREEDRASLMHVTEERPA